MAHLTRPLSHASGTMYPTLPAFPHDSAIARVNQALHLRGALLLPRLTGQSRLFLVEARVQAQGRVLLGWLTSGTVVSLTPQHWMLLVCFLKLDHCL